MAFRFRIQFQSSKEGRGSANNLKSRRRENKVSEWFQSSKEGRGSANSNETPFTLSGYVRFNPQKRDGGLPTYLSFPGSLRGFCFNPQKRDGGLPTDLGISPELFAQVSILKRGTGVCQRVLSVLLLLNNTPTFQSSKEGRGSANITWLSESLNGKILFQSSKEGRGSANLAAGWMGYVWRPWWFQSSKEGRGSANFGRIGKTCTQ